MIHELLPGKHNVLVQSGDHAILAVYKALKELGYTTILMQDQGGWLTYKDYAKRAGLESRELTTHDGLISAEHLTRYDKAALIVNSLSGYFAEQEMHLIAERCTTLGLLLINDVSGTIGTPLESYGDIILGSFGKDKPVNNHYGGFIAWHDEKYNDLFTEHFDEKQRAPLQKHLTQIKERQHTLRALAESIKKELTAFDIIHRDKKGINVVIAYKNETEKRSLVEYCQAHQYQYTLCPRSIRVKRPAVCIEVKRQKTTE